MRRRVRLAALAALLLLAVGTASGSPAGTAQAADPPAVAAPSTTLSVSVFAHDEGLVSPGQPIAVEVDLAPPGQTALTAATVKIVLTTRDLTSRGDLTSWQTAVAQGRTTGIGTRALAATTVVAGAPGARAHLVLPIPAKTLRLSGASTKVYGLAAVVSSGGTTLGTATSSLIWAGTDPTSTNVALAVPITVPSRADGLISSADLATFTAPTGVLTRELTAVADDSQATVAIDPMIIASIKALGSAAPASAQSWLAELKGLSNDIFPLQWGDADTSAELDAGQSSLLQPTSLAAALDPSHFPTPAAAPSMPATSPGASASPTPTAGSSASNVPSLAELLSWPYTLGGIVWPAGDSVGPDDFPQYAQNGLTTTILSAANTTASDFTTTTPGATLHVTGGSALVADAGISAALQTLADAATPISSGVASAALQAQLALASLTAAPSATLLATLDRGWALGGPDAGEALRTLSFDSPFTSSGSIREALLSPPTPGLQVVASSEPAPRVAAVRQLIEAESELGAFATVLDDPTLLTGPARNRLLTLLSVEWPSGSAWNSAVGTELANTDNVLESVQIVSPGSILQLSNRVLIPITVTNKLHYPANIVLHSVPSSTRLQIDSDTTKQIPADSSAKVLIPVKAQVGTGNAILEMQLYSPTRVAIGSPARAKVSVQADWEGITATAFGTFLILFFGFGVYRAIVRRRREKRAESDASPEDPSNG